MNQQNPLTLDDAVDIAVELVVSILFAGVVYVICWLVLA